MFPLQNGEIPKDVLEYLYDRFNGNIPTAYRILARNAELMRKFIDFRDEIMKKGKLSPILKEKIALKVSEINNCMPCYVSHRKKLENPNPENDLEELALDFVEVAVKRGIVDSKTINNLLERFDEDEVLEIVLVICLYMFLNTFNNLLVRRSRK